MDVHFYVHTLIVQCPWESVAAFVRLFWFHIGRMPIEALRNIFFFFSSKQTQQEKKIWAVEKNNLGVFASRLKCKSGEIQEIAVQWD